jgi:uncharacterized damage-inducible protein DinB
MGTRLDTITRLHEHRHWVRNKLLTASRGLTTDGLRKSFEMGVGSVLGTFVHLYGAETVWINVLENFANLEALERDWELLDQRWAAWLSNVKEEELDHVAERIREGKSFLTTVMDVLIHVATHQHYHAAQIVNMLRHLGVKPPPACDFIVMARENFLDEKK